MNILKGLIVACGLVAGLPAAAQDWVPEKPIRIVVGFAPGGGTDQTARLIASAAQDLFPVPLVVENRPGASGTLAAEMVAKAPPMAIPCWSPAAAKAPRCPITGPPVTALMISAAWCGSTANTW